MALTMQMDTPPSNDELFRVMVESAQDYSIFALDLQGKVVTWNAGAERTFGWKEREIVGRPGQLLYTPEDCERGVPAREMRGALENGWAEDERWHLRKDGTRIWVSGMLHRLHRNGELQGFVKIVRDLTTRHRLEESLNRSEEQFRLLVNSVRQYAIFWMDVEGRVQTWNQGCERVKGWKAEEAIGKFFGIFHTPEDRAAGLPQRQLQIAQRYGQFEGEGERVRSDGSRFYARVTLTQIRDDEGKLRGFSKVLEDISERKRAEEERQQLLESEKAARQAAEEATRLKDEFLATVSHELRTPLTSILGWANLIRSGDLDPESMSTALQTIERNAHAQAQLVNDLLDISRIITGKLHLHIEAIEPAAIVQAATEALQPAAQARGVNLDLSLEPDLGKLAGDPDRLQQIVWNLVSNAIKFTDRGGHVRVGLKRYDHTVELCVRDNGRGIPVDALPFIFDRFRQVDQSITRSHGGLGLGLAIVKHLAEMHGGSARAESDGQGTGSTFTVVLPLRQEAPSDPPGPIPASPQPGRERGRPDIRGVHVLVVDDDHDARELLKTILTLRGARVSLAASANDALWQLHDGRPDVLLCDIGMPEHDGYSLMRRLRKLPAEQGGSLPAAALTAFAREEDRARALREGFHEHLAKPIRPGDVVEAVARLSGRLEPLPE